MSESFDWFRFFEVLSQVGLAAGALYAAYYAKSGWQKEMRGQDEYKLANKLLVAAYKYRNVALSLENNMIHYKKALGKFEEVRWYSQHYGVETPEGELISEYLRKIRSLASLQDELYGDINISEALWSDKLKNLFLELFELACDFEVPFFYVDEELLLDGIITSLHNSNLRVSTSNDGEETEGNKRDIRLIIGDIEEILKPKLKS